MDTTDNKTKIKNLALNGIMLALIIAVQSVNLPNLITGIIINSILVFVSLFIGIKSAIILCLLSPFGGFITGHAPVVLFPVLPIIAIGNVLLVVFIKILSGKATGLKIIVPALIKALVIGFGGMLMIQIFKPEKIADYLLFMVLGIQFFTAIPGIWLGIKLSEKAKANNI